MMPYEARTLVIDRLIEDTCADSQDVLDVARQEILHLYSQFCAQPNHSNRVALCLYGELYEEAKARRWTETGDEYAGSYEDPVGSPSLSTKGFKLRAEALAATGRLRQPRRKLSHDAS